MVTGGLHTGNREAGPAYQQHSRGYTPPQIKPTFNIPTLKNIWSNTRVLWDVFPEMASRPLKQDASLPAQEESQHRFQQRWTAWDSSDCTRLQRLWWCLENGSRHKGVNPVHEPQKMTQVWFFKGRQVLWGFSLSSFQQLYSSGLACTTVLKEKAAESALPSLHLAHQESGH